jgi:hypothetical protein
MTLVLVTDRSGLIAFHGGPHYPHCYGPNGYAIYTPPRDTCDPRFSACTDHHPACDCREAEFAEERQEQRAWHREIQEAFDEVLAGHPLYRTDDTPGCQCTGCQIARAAHIWPRSSV